MHLNSCLMIGRVSPKGPALRYAESGSPCCSFVLEVDEVTNGKTFTTYIPCEISGKYAEQTSVEVEAGDEIQISGKWKYKSVVDQKSGAKVSKPVVSSWGVSQRIPGPSTLAQDETSREIDTSGPVETASPINAAEPVPGHKTRKRATPAHLRKPWVASRLEASEN